MRNDPLSTYLTTTSGSLKTNFRKQIVADCKARDNAKADMDPRDGFICERGEANSTVATIYGKNQRMVMKSGPAEPPRVSTTSYMQGSGSEGNKVVSTFTMEDFYRIGHLDQGADYESTTYAANGAKAQEPRLDLITLFHEEWQNG